MSAMLVGLSIRDIVLIEKLDIAWHPGLCALTGETGAGKSILLDALGLTIGYRAAAGLVRHGAAQGSVTAEFKVPADHPARRILSDQGLPAGETLLLRRVLGRRRKRRPPRPSGGLPRSGRTKIICATPWASSRRLIPNRARKPI